jgi:hypothetical protein
MKDMHAGDAGHTIPDEETELIVKASVDQRYWFQKLASFNRTPAISGELTTEGAHALIELLEFTKEDVFWDLSCGVGKVGTSCLTYRLTIIQYAGGGTGCLGNRCCEVHGSGIEPVQVFVMLMSCVITMLRPGFAMAATVLHPFVQKIPNIVTLKNRIALPRCL